MKIKSIKSNGVKPTWDLTVPNEEHYIMSNGCVSHNTAQILGNNEAFEPFTTNIYSRRTLGGEFVMVNKHLVNVLLEHGLWNDEIKNKIIMENGSVQNIPEIPTEIKEVYKTVWEMSQKRLIEMSANRGIFIDQSQSLNLFIDNVTKTKLLAAHLYGWRLGLKTGMYYLRTKSAVDAIKGLGMDVSAIKVEETPPEIPLQPIDSPFECEGCGS